MDFQKFANGLRGLNQALLPSGLTTGRRLVNEMHDPENVANQAGKYWAEHPDYQGLDDKPFEQQAAINVSPWHGPQASLGQMYKYAGKGDLEGALVTGLGAALQPFAVGAKQGLLLTKNAAKKFVGGATPVVSKPGLAAQSAETFYTPTVAAEELPINVDVAGQINSRKRR